MAVGSFGSIDFIIPELRGQELEGEINWVEIPTLSGYPRLQRVGDELRKITLNIVFDGHSGTSPKDRMQALRNRADLGLREALVIGNEAYGDYLIKSYRVTYVETFDNGHPRKIEMRLDLWQAPEAAFS